MTKKCSKCTKNKPFSAFTKDKRYELGLFCWCKECKKLYANANPQQVQNWVKAHRDESNAIKLAYVQRNPDKAKASKKRWSKANPKKELAKCRKYQAAKLNATPKWLTKAQLKEIETIYVNCPKGYHVDHIVPLRGKNVKGLHVPWNLRYLSALENSRKSNKY